MYSNETLEEKPFIFNDLDAASSELHHTVATAGATHFTPKWRCI